MHNIILVDKPIGMTPLEAINSLKKKRPELSNEKITYAGRLDPLAHGLLLLLSGEEAKKRENYLSMNKVYTFEVVFGLTTDTYDMLGIIKNSQVKKVPRNVNLIVNTFINNHVGKQLQSYPPYSSKPVNGKPLFWWAKKNKLDEIIIPEHEIAIETFEMISTGEIAAQDMGITVKNAVLSVQGDFRQEIIEEKWKTFFKHNVNTKLQTMKFRVTCSSGTYIRALVHELGEVIGCGAMALDILRTDIGSYSLADAITL